MPRRRAPKRGTRPAPPPALPLPEPEWAEGAPGWRIARSVPSGTSLSLVELVHEDGRVLRLVPQDAAVRALAQANPMGRLIGSAFAEVFSSLKQIDRGDDPERVKDRAHARRGVALLDMVGEMAADREAKRIIPLGGITVPNPDHRACREGKHRAREAAVLHADTHATCYRCGVSVRKDDPLLTIEASVACRRPL